jgi:uncharacterized membrane protein
VNLAPQLSASPAIQFHAFAAVPASGLGLVQLTASRGTLPHRTIGWIWVVLMGVMSVSAFFIHAMRLGNGGLIHLLAIFTLTVLPITVWYAHSHAVRKHRNVMVTLFIDALVIAGALTLLPGRIMHAVVFSPARRVAWATRPAAMSNRRARRTEIGKHPNCRAMTAQWE